MTDARPTDTEAPWLDLLKDILLRVPAYLKLGWALARAPEVPREKKTGLLGGVLYSMSPIDPVPGFIPVLGQLDDMAALLFGIRYALRHCPPEVADRLMAESGVDREQLDRDLRTLIPIARGFSTTVARGAWRGSRAVGRVVGRGLTQGSKALWRWYRQRSIPVVPVVVTELDPAPIRPKPTPEPEA